MRLWYLVLTIYMYATSEGSDEPVHPCSLARAFAIRTHEIWKYKKDQTKYQTSTTAHWMAAHAGLKNEFTEDEKYHNLMSRLK